MKTQQVFDGTQVIHKIMFTNQSSIVQVIESIFDDITIYNDKKIKQLIQSSPKGFIDLDQLINLPIFSDFVQKNPNILITPDEIIRCVQEYSKKLVAIDYRIRRIQPFVDNIKNKKLTPIYVDRLPAINTDEVCQFFKNIVGVIYQIYHKKIQKWAVIVIDNFEALQPIKDQLYLEGQKISVLDPIQTLVSYGDNERLSSDFNILRLYQNKNMWQFPQQQNSDEELQFHFKMKQKKRFSQLRFRKEMENMDSMEDMDSFESDHSQKAKKKRRNQLRKYQNDHREDQFNHRIRNLQNQRRLKQQVDHIKNFDNTPLLQLRSFNIMTMTQ